MAKLPRSSSNWMLSLKVLLISCGVVSMAVVLKLFVPVMLEFAVSGVPVILISFRSWLKPPYLYVVINGIIIIIAASSRLCHKLDEDNRSVSQTTVVEDSRSEFVYEAKTAEISLQFGYEVKTPVDISTDFTLLQTPAVIYEQSEGSVSEMKAGVIKLEPEDEDDEFVISRSNWSLERMDSSEISLENLQSAEKPLVSARFNRRKLVKASPEGGKTLRVMKPKRQETFENTWKAITDGRPVPLTRHLRKSDTWENHGRQINAVPLDLNAMKSETFRDRTNNPPPPVTSSPAGSGGKLRKEPSMSQDDLNRRVEAFIKKFNEEMMLQRQESLNQYKEMINRGAS